MCVANTWNLAHFALEAMCAETMARHGSMMVAVVSTDSGSAAAMEEAPKLLWLWTVMQPWDSCSHFIDTLRAVVEAVQAWSIEYQEVVYDVVESAINAVSDTRALANFLARACLRQRHELLLQAICVGRTAP